MRYTRLFQVSLSDSRCAAHGPFRRRAGIDLVGLLTVALSVSAPCFGQVVSEAIGTDIVRFHKSASAQANALPSMALEGSWPGIAPKPAGFPLSVNFSSGGGREIAIVPVPADTDLYGTGMVTGPLRRNGRFITCWNDDSYAYGDGDTQIYESHPWVMGVRPDGSAFGVIADTTYRCDVDLTDPVGVGIRFSAEGRAYPVIIIERPGPREVVTALAELTGTMPMPPKWALGYHQSRWAYDTESYARWIADQFRNRNIPCDAIWLDITYMDGYRVFTFDPGGFPNPTQFNADLHAQGFRTVWNNDPGVKVEPGYFVHDQGLAGDYWVKTSNGISNYQGEVWPGWCYFPDFTRTDVRSWWAGLYASFVTTGMDGAWNDMNEPAVFNATGWTMPENNIHRGDAAFGGTLPHSKYHNVYGMLMARVTREGLLQADPNKRPFVLTRANYLGGHRYAATWTGDNVSNWYHLQVSVPMALTLGLSGQPFSGPDIGGFVDYGSGSLYGRWMGFGAMLPFARGHYTGSSGDKEPWSFGTYVEDASRRALERRYRMMPYIYTIFRESHVTGMPVVRPLLFADPTDPALRAEEDAFLLGGDVMVVPELSPQRDYDAALPQGVWQPFDFDDAHPELPQLYLRGGAIVPTGPVMQYVDADPLDPLTLIVALDGTGHAQGMLYEDTGDGYDYLSGDYLLTTYSAELVGDQCTVSIAGVDGNRARPSRALHVRLLVEPGYEVSAVGTDGAPLTFTVPPAPHEPTPVYVMDGADIAADHTPASLVLTQDTATQFGDNLSELNRMFVRAERHGLRIGITGNLEHNGNGLILLLDTTAGGQETLNTAVVSAPPDGVAELHGTRLDVGFAPDHMYHINAGDGSFWLDYFPLNTGGAGAKVFKGTGGTGSDMCELLHGDVATDVQIAFNNRNTAGVTDSSAANASTATTGFEIYIPYSDMGLSDPAGGSIGITAFVNGKGFVSNQWLPGVNGRGNLGYSPDLRNVPGTQHVFVPVRFFGDFDGDGDADINDVDVFVSCASGPAHPHDGSTDCDAADFDDDGDVDSSDFGVMQRCLSGSGTLADPACAATP